MDIARPWQAPKHILTERLHLRCPRQDDGPELRRAIEASLARLRPWFNWAVDVKISEISAAASVRYARLAFDAGTEYQYFIFPQGDETLVGTCGLTRLDLSLQTGEVVYWLRTGFEGRGYATEAVGALVEKALEEGGFNHIEAFCDVTNGSGQAVLQRLGFRQANILPGHRQHPDTGRWVDVVHFVRDA